MKNHSDDERRKARRFQIGWDVAVSGTDRAGRSFAEAGMIKNLSSAGALFHLPRRMQIGTKLELRIRIPFNKNNWMKYAAEVVRVKRADNTGIAVKFNTSRPVFSDA